MAWRNYSTLCSNPDSACYVEGDGVMKERNIRARLMVSYTGFLLQRLGLFLDQASLHRVRGPWASVTPIST